MEEWLVTDCMIYIFVNTALLCSDYHCIRTVSTDYVSYLDESHTTPAHTTRAQIPSMLLVLGPPHGQRLVHQTESDRFVK